LEDDFIYYYLKDGIFKINFMQNINRSIFNLVNMKIYDVKKYKFYDLEITKYIIKLLNLKKGMKKLKIINLINFN